jgi:hypothetical protein
MIQIIAVIRATQTLAAVIAAVTAAAAVTEVLTWTVLAQI